MINNTSKIILITILGVLLLAACSSGILFFKSTSNKLPKGFPEIPYPKDNFFSKERWLLGKKLFYDTRLSLDNSISCASCHKPTLAFSDSIALSKGSGNQDGTRNAPSLGNVAYHPYYTRDGGVATLEMQVLVPIQEHNEFNFNILEVSERLKKIPEYTKLSTKAYNRELDYYVITRALANFERTLITGESKYDLYTRKKTKLNESENRGLTLFFSEKTKCSECHSGFNFTNYSFENTGLYEKYNDIGRKRLTHEDKDLEKFKVPSLRNVAITAPYMHDGSIKTLEGVIEHYNSGGKTNKQKSEKIKSLSLNTQDKKDLIAFLNTLTDTKFIQNKNFKP